MVYGPVKSHAAALGSRRPLFGSQKVCRADDGNTASSRGLVGLFQHRDVALIVLTSMPFESLGRVAMASKELASAAESTVQLLSERASLPSTNLPSSTGRRQPPPLRLLAQVRCVAMLRSALRSADIEPLHHEYDRILAADQAFDTEGEGQYSSTLRFVDAALDRDRLAKRLCVAPQYRQCEATQDIRALLQGLRERGSGSFSEWAWKIYGGNNPAQRFVVAMDSAVEQVEGGDIAGAVKSVGGLIGLESKCSRLLCGVLTCEPNHELDDDVLRTLMRVLRIAGGCPQWDPEPHRALVTNLTGQCRIQDVLGFSRQ